MNEQSLTARGRIDPERLDRERYAESLAAEAVRVGIMTQGDVERIRVSLLKVLAEVIGYKTGGESTNVSVNDAGSLAESLLFNVGTALRAESDPDAAAHLLRDGSVSELYAKGYAINKKRWEDAKRLWAKVRYAGFRNGGEELARAVDRNIRIYLERYDPRISAHDKLYLSLPKLGIKGAFHIQGAVAVLTKILSMNSADSANRPDAAFRAKEEEPNS